MRSIFHDNGYATLRERLSSTRVKALRCEVGRLCKAGWPNCPRGDVFFQDVANPQLLKQVQQVHRQSELFAAVAEDVCRPIAESLFASGRAMLVNAQFFNKTSWWTERRHAVAPGRLLLPHNAQERGVDVLGGARPSGPGQRRSRVREVIH